MTKFKFVYLIAIAVLFIDIIHANDYDNLIYMWGIGTTMPSGMTSNTIGIEAQANEISKAFEKITQKKVIVGQSQGGVRALAFANNYPNQTAAVITIGSPVKGHPMLLNVQTTKNSLNDAVKTIVDGGLNVVPVLGPIVVGFSTAFIPGNTIGDKIVNVCLDCKVYKDNLCMRDLLNMAQDTTTTQYPGISDLNPKSPFMQHTIYHAGCKVTVETVKVQTGTSTAPQVIGSSTGYIPGTTFQALDNTKIPVLTTPEYNIYILFKVDIPQKIPSDVYVSFIRGTQNDPLSYFDSAKRQEVRGMMDTYMNVTLTAGNIERGLAISAGVAAVGLACCLNIPGAIAAAASSAALGDSSQRCYNGHDWVSGYVTNFGNLLGETRNDCFIPYSAQAWNTSQIGGTPMGASEVVAEFPVNHAEELSDSRIWGTGGAMGKALNDGYVATLLQYTQNKLNSTTGSAISDGVYIGRDDQNKPSGK